MSESISVHSRIVRFTVNHKRYVFLAVLLATATVATAAFVSVRFNGNAKAAGKTATSPAAGNTDGPREHVHKGRLHPQLRETLTALGDRLDRSGKERLTLVGTLSHQVNSQMVTADIRLMTEYPHRLRLEMRQGNQMHTLGFDGHNGWKHGSALGRDDQNLIESLLFDSADHFFIGQEMGLGTRPLGTRFRLDDGSDPNYSGPYFDVYRFNDQVGAGPDKRSQEKLYYFNSDTLLLDHITYDLNRDGGTVKVEVKFTNYQKINGQQIPTAVSRLEDGNTVLTLNVASVGFDRWHRDATFDAASNQ